MALHMKSTGIDYADFGHGNVTPANELLDDYEEGTYTPVVNGGDSGNTAAVGNFAGVYTKIGRNIHTNQMFTLTSRNSIGGNVQFGGYPFTPSDVLAQTSYEASGPCAHWLAVTDVHNIIVMLAQQGYAYWFYTNGALDTPLTATSNFLSDSTAGRFSLTYFSHI